MATPRPTQPTPRPTRPTEPATRPTQPTVTSELCLLDGVSAVSALIDTGHTRREVTSRGVDALLYLGTEMFIFSVSDVLKKRGQKYFMQVISFYIFLHYLHLVVLTVCQGVNIKPILCRRFCSKTISINLEPPYNKKKIVIYLLYFNTQRSNWAHFPFTCFKKKTMRRQDFASYSLQNICIVLLIYYVNSSIQGPQFWRKAKNSDVAQGPYIIVDQWPGGPTTLDSAYERPDGSIVFFKGKIRYIRKIT